MVQVFAPLRSAHGIRPPDEPGPIFRFLTIYAFFYLQDTIQFHLLRSPWRSTGRLRTSKLPLCYHFSKTQQEIFPHHTAAYIKSLRFPVYRLFYSSYNIEVTRSWSGNRPPTVAERRPELWVQVRFGTIKEKGLWKKHSPEKKKDQGFIINPKVLLSVIISLQWKLIT